MYPVMLLLPRAGVQGYRGYMLLLPREGVHLIEGVQGYMPMLLSRKGWRVAGGGGGRSECPPTPKKNLKKVKKRV